MNRSANHSMGHTVNRLNGTFRGPFGEWTTIASFGVHWEERVQG